MTSWFSPTIPQYIDQDALLSTVYELFYRYAPCKSGTMRSGIDYIQTGNASYWWDDVVYAGYQDTATSFAGWWSEELPATFDQVLSEYEAMAQDDDRTLPDWLESLVDDLVNQ